MARPLPVPARDILAQTELASGAGVLRDVVLIADDASAPLAEKVAIYGASAVMAPAERARLDTLLEVVQRQAPALPLATPGAIFPALSAPSETVPLPQEAMSGKTADPTEPTPPDDAPKPPPNGGPNGHSGDMHTGALPAMSPLRLVTPPEWRRAQSSGHASRDKRDVHREQQLKTQAFALLDENQAMSRNALRAALKVRRETAARLYTQWQRARTQPHVHIAAGR
jgi:hypothetical protein